MSRRGAPWAYFFLARHFSLLFFHLQPACLHFLDFFCFAQSAHFSFFAFHAQPALVHFFSFFCSQTIPFFTILESITKSFTTNC